ncbi:hypothetical protein ACE7GA_00375 [Roseomonas sp. CCTCC AB2023176]|uniref:hypothetical protein n=1 Tax=Roseomonas sp. CCTCC AB2023176 TaxID=3342640 RepID=UPI0035DCD038
MTTAQRAMRLFAVLVAGGERPAPEGAVSIFRGETRLNALMFWLRNPDYLAWEFLDIHERTKKPAPLLFVRRMVQDEEPILRRDAMLKWRFGAYEPVDDELAILASVGLVRTITKPAGTRSAGNDFLLLPGSFELAESLEENVAYRWYGERMKVVAAVAGSEGGSALKERQYKHLEYFKTSPHQPIKSILPRVLERLAQLSSVA